MSGPVQTRVLVIPVLRRYWLFHAWKEAPVQQAVKPWQEGAGLQEKLSLLLGSLQGKAARNVEKQWNKLETAPEGSLNNKLFRLAQYVLSRVDPSESFLKALPQQAQSLEIIYPSSLPERLVRRRLRLMAAKAQPFHASRLRVWAAALVPQLPLIPLPLPNVTIYYTAWRIASNYSARKGAAALAASLQLSSDMQRAALAQQLVALQRQGVKLRPGSWAEQLAADADRLQEAVNAAHASMQHSSDSTASSTSSRQQHQQQHPKRLPPPVLIGDSQLEQLLQPRERLTTPLPESAVVQMMEMYKQPHLLEHYRAANRKCLSDKQQQQQQDGIHHHQRQQQQNCDQQEQQGYTGRTIQQQHS